MRNFANTELSELVGKEPTYQAPVSEQVIPPQVAKFVDRLFFRLKAIFPAWKAAFDGEESYQETKRFWLEALVNNGVTTAAQFKRGIARAERSESPYFPSVGQFIAWCNTENYAELGLPTPDELKHRLNKFRANGGFSEIDRFEFMSDAEYWLITEIANKSIQKSYSEAEELQAMKEALEKMAKRLEKGEVLPKPTRSLPEKVEYLDPEKVKQGWANLKALVARG
ncbi:replication protein P [Gallibacterium salpingitidis]|uniref:replication protein P n=1 Tax=Gallibacterium salpingitidis TaxID=505341 RepID=UPI0026704E4E|nr:replication protein P [Gallibacterium salpingitidis]WKS98499.1 replication protein P [Gallibacterium salpingitidis]